MPSKIDDALPVAGGLRERGKRRRSKQILDAARVLLREAPDQELTVERIAARAELSPQTVYNLIGRREHIWGALADDALDALNLPRFAAIADPRVRGTAIVQAVIDMVCDDTPVFRHLLAHWAQSALFIDHDPTAALTDCFLQVGDPRPRRTAELVGAGLIGILHQWAAELISDDGARERGRDLVSLAFHGS
jgi:AcrR family transcriptional regulator